MPKLTLFYWGDFSFILADIKWVTVSMKRNSKAITKNSLFPPLLFLIFILIFSFCNVTPTSASYLISFSSDVAEITAPAQNGVACDGIITIQGTSPLNQIWLCVRGPQGEVTTYPIKVEQNSFQYDLSLRFGAGTYTIWAGNSPHYFDGQIRFEVINTLDKDLRYLAPSAYVDSNNKIVTQLCNSLMKPNMTDEEKLDNIYEWVTNNISYDYDAYLSDQDELLPASLIIQKRKGACRDYSFTIAALARAAGLEAKVVYGHARNGNSKPEYHAWNEIKVNDQWVAVDSTWDAGYVKNGKFTFSPQKKYFNIIPSAFSQSHKVEKVTLH